MDPIQQAIACLEEQKAALTTAISALRATGKRRGRPPAAKKTTATKRRGPSPEGIERLRKATAKRWKDAKKEGKHSLGKV